MEPILSSWVLFKIILINLVLSGDNAIVIALACRNLPETHKRIAFLFGSAGAVVSMIGLTFVALRLLELPLVQAGGGLLLVWIALKLLRGDEDEGRVKTHDTLWRAVGTIIFADVVMSLDNTVAVAATAQGNTLLIGIGLAVSIPLIIWGANLLANLMNRFPWIIWGGAMLLGYTAGEMMMKDRVLGLDLVRWFPTYHWLLPYVVAGLVLLIGKLREVKRVRA